MSKKIIFSAGGTGGHIFPAVNLMEHFLNKGYEVLLVTDTRGNNFIKKNLKFRSCIIKAGTPTNKSIFKRLLSFFIIFYSIIKAIIILKKERPDLIFGFGGYVSFPISFASKFFKLPLIIYENNMILGRTNKYLSSYSKKILIAKKITEDFPEKYRSKTYEVGEILNKNIINYSNSEKNYNSENFSILVLGGSQGAEIFGSVVPPAISKIKKAGYEIEIKQQCVRSQKNEIINFYKQNNIKNYVFEFDQDILKLISSSSLAITRCGASTTAELAYTFTPFIAVPLPNSIDNHQYLNAKYYSDRGRCWLLEQKVFNSENLFNLVVDVIKNKNKLKDISENLKKDYRRDVYSDIESKIKEII
tara:strand:- start:1136 stop:2215 length:1080 start_codon:yes stop_codon:yes gene_type:complete